MVVSGGGVVRWTGDRADGRTGERWVSGLEYE